ncbi:MAG TPA: hypothetical protein VLA23_02350 [Candidatus Limnocylindrales bacterium]|nr:hypothetical protein [Candidatus Limnocylindrales bacterium]
MTGAGVLAERLRREGLDPSSWGNGPGDRYAAHEHGYDKVLVCAAGSIVFEVVGTPIGLHPGDRLDLPAGTVHGAIVGADGVTCLEAHLPAGTLPRLHRVPAGSW